jgi:hypothetical protein
MKLAVKNKKTDRRPRTNVWAIIEAFANSDERCREVTDFTQKSANVCATSLKQAIKRYRHYSIWVFTRKGRVFMIKV